MKKIRLKCFFDYIEVNGISNYEIYCYQSGGLDFRTLATCMNCGELFVYDEQELFSKGVKLTQRTEGLKCPKCNTELNKTIEKYPDSFRTKNNTIGHRIFSTSLSSTEDKMKTIVVWDLFS